MAEREFIVKEWRDDKGILHIREVGQELIRCKECKKSFSVEGEWICNHLSGMVGLNVVVKADDFCSSGEREGE